jgi:hypothetical protein
MIDRSSRLLAVMIVHWALTRLVWGQAVDASGSAVEPEGRAGLADLPDLLRAIEGRPPLGQAGTGDSAVAVTPGQLLAEALRYRDRQVVLRGQVVRAFHQAGVGDFPPLSELWVSTGDGQLFCVVMPRVAVRDGSARFTGRFLGIRSYRSAQGWREAPLIAGPGPPRWEAPGPSRPGGRAPTVWTPASWVAVLAITVALGAGVAWIKRRSGTEKSGILDAPGWDAAIEFQTPEPNGHQKPGP